MAICVNINISGKATENLDLSLVWNMPKIHFSDDTETTFKRFYTKFFHEENKNCSLDISTYSISNKQKWIADLKEWRTSIINNK